MSQAPDRIHHIHRRTARSGLRSLVLGLCLVAASASAGIDPSNDVQVPLPTAFGGVVGVGVSGAMGAVSDSVAIEAAPGRAGMKPRLALSFRSLAGNGIAGLGWSLATGSVERWRGDGTPSVHATIDGTPSDRYGYSVGGAGGELHDENGDGVYRARIESVYRPFRKHGDGWLMYDGQGVAYHFGSAPQSRIDGELWMVDRVEDPSGNTIVYVYDRECALAVPGQPCDADNPALHLSAVHYTGHASRGNLGANVVALEYEPRPDRSVSYRRGVREARNLRLRRIAVHAQGGLVRAYDLAYAQYRDGPSVLTGVTLVGRDGQSEIPLRTFAYHERELGWPNPLPGADVPVALVDVEGTGTGGQLMDVDGDGFADAVDNGANVHLGDGQGGFARSSPWSASLAAADARIVDEEGIDTGVRFLDVDGDARPDILVATPFRSEVLLNTGSGWQHDAVWTANLASLSALSIALFDPDASTDCRAPLCSAFGENPPAGCSAPYCTGDAETDPEDCLVLEEGETEAPFCGSPSYSDSGSEPFSVIGEAGESKGVEFTDVNADGRADIVWSLQYDQSVFVNNVPRIVRAVFLNGGSDDPGWHQSNSLSGALAGVLTNQGGAAGAFVVEARYQGYSFMDANGDGLADIVRSIAGQQAVYLGHGGGWTFDPAYTSSMIGEGIFALDADFVGQGLLTIDLNDDGLGDYVRAKDGEPVQVYRNTGTGWVPDAFLSGVVADSGITFADGEGRGTGATLADVDGNGVVDLVSASASTDRILLGDGLASGKLERAVTALGQVAELTWIPSSAFDHTTDGGIHGLPVVLTLVESLTRSNGPTDSFHAAFAYEGGVYGATGFLGFAAVTQSPSAGLRTESFFYQDEDRAFQPYEVRSFDSADVMRSRSETETVIRDAELGVRQPLLTSTRTERFAADGTPTTTSLVEREYDEFLQATSVDSDPQQEIAGDEHEVSYDWLRDPAAGIWARMTSATGRGPGGEIVTETETLFDARGLPVTTREILGGGDYVETLIDYDSFGNPIRVTDRAGGVTTFGYDPAGTFRIRATDPLGRVRRSEYDPGFGEIVLDVDPSGNETATTYDAFGRKAKVVAPGDEASPFGTATYLYSDVGDPAAQHFKLLRTENAGTSDVFETTTYFDAAGRIHRNETESAEGSPIVTVVEFGPDGQPIASSLPYFDGDVAPTLWSQRDDLGRLVEMTDPLNQTIRMRYEGFAVEVSDARGNVTDVVVNAAGNPTQVRLVVDGENHTTSYAYDVAGHLTEVVDALGSTTAITYDALGRRTRFDDPNTGPYTYAYDGEGRLTEQVAPDGATTRYVYSAAGELIEKQLPDGSIHRLHYGTSETPNATGQLVRVEDDSGTLELSYDARGRVIERRRMVGGQTYVTGVTYDSMDRIRDVIYPDGFVASYEYDAGNNLAAITDLDGHPIVEGLQYDAARRITELAFGNGVTMEASYDLMARMLSSRTRTGAGVDLQDLVYEYDAANNVLAMNDLATGRNQAFEYDEANRLVRAVGAYGEEEYAYDAVGSLLRKGNLLFAHDPSRPQRLLCGLELGASGPGKGKGKKNSNRTSEPCADSLGVDPGDVARAFFVGYDGRGNVVAKGDRRYEYDGENRLVAATNDEGHFVETNLYDTSGELVVKQDRSSMVVYVDGLYEEGNSHVSKHVYAGSLLVATLVTPRAQTRLIASAHPSANRAYYAAGFSGVGSLLLLLPVIAYRRAWPRTRRALAETLRAVRSRPGRLALVLLAAFATWPSMARGNHGNSEDGERRHYYHANHLGSVNVVTDELAEVVARRDYRPYGDPHAWEGSNAGPREVLQTFQGHRFDDDTALYHLNARHYDAELGRFTSPDTIVADTGDPRTLNRYGFSGGNPVQFVDPTGRSFFSAVGDFFNDAADAFTDAANWIADNAVEILTVVVIVVVVVLIVAAVVLTGGLAAIAAGSIGLGSISAFGALGSAIGFATFGGIALAQGNSVATGEFWIAAGTGAVLGGLVGAALPVAFFPATTIAGQIAAGALIGAATGGLEQAIACATGCGGVENLFLPVAQGIIIGGIIGAAGGAIAGKFFPRGTTIGNRIGRFLVEPGKVGLTLKTVYSSYSSAGGPGLRGRRTAAGDVLRLLKVGFGVGDEKAGDLQRGDRTGYFFGALDGAETGLATAPMSP